MKKILILLLFIFCGCNKIPQTSPIVQIRSSHDRGIAKGSGFVLKYRNRFFLITAGHVIYGSNLSWALDENNLYLPINFDNSIIPNYNDASITLLSSTPNDNYYEISPVLIVDGTDCTSRGFSKGYDDTTYKGTIIGTLPIPNAGKLRKYILTDIPLKPSMSGGPLLIDGKVVGINAMTNHSGDLGYHTPISIVTRQIDDILNHLE